MLTILALSASVHQESWIESDYLPSHLHSCELSPKEIQAFHLLGEAWLVKYSV